MDGRTLLKRLILVCLAIRVALEAIGLLSLAAHDQPVWSQALSFWNRWDAHHYLRLAETGYVAEPNPPPNADDPLYIVFFPFFPFATKLVALVVRDVIASGLVVSFAATVGALWFLHRLVELDSDAGDAWRAVVLVLAFPTAYYLAAPYSEALFLFAVTASMYAARTNRWTRSGLAGALATGTRVTGVALLPALAVEALTTNGAMRVRTKRLLSASLAGVGLLTYLAINQIVHGDAFHFLFVQRTHWYQEAVPPWRPLADSVGAIARGIERSDLAFIHFGRVIAFVLAVPLLALAIRRVRAADSVYAWGSFILMLSASWLLSLPRYLLVLYPLFIVGAKLARSPRVLYPVVTVGIALQVWFFWRYAVGAWTF